MSTTATRLLTLILLLQRRPSQKAVESADPLSVLVRTVQRYIAMLDEMGIPVCSDRGPHGGNSPVRAYRMPPLIFSPEEAVAIYLGTGLASNVGQTVRECRTERAGQAGQRAPGRAATRGGIGSAHPCCIALASGGSGSAGANTREASHGIARAPQRAHVLSVTKPP